MRLGVWNEYSRHLGGTESYLNDILPSLAGRGCSIAYACEWDGPEGRAAVSLPSGSPLWVRSGMGTSELVNCMREWNPDLIFVHGRIEPHLESELLRLAPSVYFVHNYYGTCISGLKAHQFPQLRPCTKTFGPACLLHYFPRHCGGSSPFTMWRLYNEEKTRLQGLKNYNALVTNSGYMRDEFVRHGLERKRVHSFEFAAAAEVPELSEAPSFTSDLHCAFLGRMDGLKGGEILLQALPEAAARLGRHLTVTMAGDGPSRSRWEALAGDVQSRSTSLTIRFPGWVDQKGRETILRKAHLLVVPSVWPEPFGKIGPEAGFYGVPAAAFDVGGIGDWLTDGVNGCLAPGSPPEKSGLAQAIHWCLENEERYAQLRTGARVEAERFLLASHTEKLIEIFEQVLRQ